MPDPEKICVICGQSCAGQPRIKNEKGQYAHQACAKQHAAEPEPTGVPSTSGLDGDDDLMDALFDDLPGSEPAGDAGLGGLQSGCPGCGGIITPETVVCTNCGFNTRTGKGLKTKVSAPPKAAGAIGSVAGAAGGFAAAGTAFLLGSVLGGAAGAGIGAAVWAGIVIGTGYEVGYIAIGVGALCGIGTAIGSRGQTGMMTGVIAVLFTILAICGGKYFAVSHLASEFFAEQGVPGAFLDEMDREELDVYMMQGIIDDLVYERLEDGDLSEAQTAAYDTMLEEGVFPDDYPDDLVEETRRIWLDLGEDERTEWVEAKRREIQAASAAIEQIIREDGFVSTFGPMDILFFVIAIAAGYKLGTGGDE